ncbi:MAG: hypothetical protein HQM16_06415 [Deltaproteobacteria bacterium]|nr:hypothetical protein [Deltaproteobacteria bacterium]
MLDSNPKNILSMTELQKLSFKKITSMRLGDQPLLLMDKKINAEAFVILNYKTYETLQNKNVQKQNKQIRPLQIKKFDFKKSGMFWDRPHMNNKKFADILLDTRHSDHAWAVSRFFERLPSQVILKILSFDTVIKLFEKAQLREPIKGAWKDAITYWNQKTSCYR